MGLIRGIDIVLHVKEEVGIDAFNNPIFETHKEIIHNVLIGEPTSDEVTTSTALYGRRAQFTLAIPKVDTHDWEDVTIEFFGHKWKSFGIPIEGILSMLPLDWNKKVMVERYE